MVAEEAMAALVEAAKAASVVELRAPDLRRRATWSAAAMVTAAVASSGRR